jgi:hypothetical protein
VAAYLSPGNPAGKPRGARDLLTAIAEHLMQTDAEAVLETGVVGSFPTKFQSRKFQKQKPKNFIKKCNKKSIESL